MSLEKKKDMPPCAGVDGSKCKKPNQDVLIAGYDDQLRCVKCNNRHLVLVEREAGSSNPLLSRSEHLSKSLSDKVAKKRLEAVFSHMQNRGHRGTKSNAPIKPIADGQPLDMKSMSLVNEINKNLSKEERRKGILKKYSNNRR